MTAVDGMKQLAKPWYSDQILPFDITLAGASELGAATAMKIFGVEILNEGSGVSIVAEVTKMQATFVARTRCFATKMKFLFPHGREGGRSPSHIARSEAACTLRRSPPSNAPCVEVSGCSSSLGTRSYCPVANLGGCPMLMIERRRSVGPGRRAPPPWGPPVLPALAPGFPLKSFHSSRISWPVRFGFLGDATAWVPRVRSLGFGLRGCIRRNVLGEGWPPGCGLGWCW